MAVVPAVEITLLVALVVMWALHWRTQRLLVQRFDGRDDALYKKHKALTRDAQRTKLAADRTLEETRSLHASNRDVLGDPRVQRLLNERRLPHIPE